MIVSGNISRDILRENKFSVNLDLFLDNCTGRSEIGFSGQGITYKFSFTSGKIFDPENRYFSSYLPNEFVNIKTNFSGTTYDYSINESNILKSGSKQGFYAEKFYINTTGTTIDASIEIKSKKPTLSLSFPDSFVTGSPVTGYVVTDSASGIKLFSGYFEPDCPLSFSSVPNGLISSSSVGQIVVSGSPFLTGPIDTKVFFDTSAGDYSMQFLINGTESPYINYIFEVVQGSNVEESNSTSFRLYYTYVTNSTPLIPANLPLDISLSYYSGITGYYGLVTGVQINSGGNGYLSAPTVTFSGGGGSLASGIALLGVTAVDYNSVEIVQITSFGSGYTSSPTISFSGGTGIIGNTNPTIASGAALTTFYTKSFTGIFNLITGQDSNFANYRDNSFVLGTKYVKTGSVVGENSFIDIQIDYNTSFDDDPMVAKLVISGINDNIIEEYLTATK